MPGIMKLLIIIIIIITKAERDRDRAICGLCSSGSQKRVLVKCVRCVCVQCVWAHR